MCAGSSPSEAFRTTPLVGNEDAFAEGRIASAWNRGQIAEARRVEEIFVERFREVVVQEAVGQTANERGVSSKEAFDLRSETTHGLLADEFRLLRV